MLNYNAESYRMRLYNQYISENVLLMKRPLIRIALMQRNPVFFEEFSTPIFWNKRFTTGLGLSLRHKLRYLDAMTTNSGFIIYHIPQEWLLHYEGSGDIVYDKNIYNYFSKFSFLKPISKGIPILWLLLSFYFWKNVKKALLENVSNIVIKDNSIFDPLLEIEAKEKEKIYLSEIVKLQLKAGIKSKSKSEDYTFDLFNAKENLTSDMLVETFANKKFKYLKKKKKLGHIKEIKKDLDKGERKKIWHCYIIYNIYFLQGIKKL